MAGGLSGGDREHRPPLSERDRRRRPTHGLQVSRPQSQRKGEESMISDEFYRVRTTRPASCAWSSARTAKLRKVKTGDTDARFSYSPIPVQTRPGSPRACRSNAPTATTRGRHSHAARPHQPSASPSLPLLTGSSHGKHCSILTRCDRLADPSVLPVSRLYDATTGWRT